MEGWFDAFGGMVSMTLGDSPPKMAGFAEARKRHTASFRHCRGLRSKEAGGEFAGKRGCLAWDSDLQVWGTKGPSENRHRRNASLSRQICGPELVLVFSCPLLHA